MIKRKGSKSTQVLNQGDIEHKIDDVIKRGGAVAEQDTDDSIPEELTQEEFRFTLRGPKSLLQEIDKAKKSRIGSISRNQWILEAIEERLQLQRN